MDLADACRLFGWGQFPTGVMRDFESSLTGVFDGDTRTGRVPTPRP